MRRVVGFGIFGLLSLSLSLVVVLVFVSSPVVLVDLVLVGLLVVSGLVDEPVELEMSLVVLVAEDVFDDESDLEEVAVEVVCVEVDAVSVVDMEELDLVEVVSVVLVLSS